MKIRKGNEVLEKLANSCKKNHSRASLILPSHYSENSSYNRSFVLDSPSKLDLSKKRTPYRSPVPSPIDVSPEGSFANSIRLIGKPKAVNDNFNPSCLAQDPRENTEFNDLKAENKQLRKQLEVRDREVKKLKNLLRAVGVNYKEKLQLSDNIRMKPDCYQVSNLFKTTTEELDFKVKERNRRINELQETFKRISEHHQALERSFDERCL